jgi:hypothetical protein
MVPYLLAYKSLLGRRYRNSLIILLDILRRLDILQVERAFFDGGHGGCCGVPNG